MVGNSRGAREVRLDGAREAVLVPGGERTFLYVVLRAGVGVGGLDTTRAGGIDAVIPVARLPRNADGAVDVDALRAVGELDEPLRARAEAELASMPGVREAAVVIRDKTAPLPHLHPTRLAQLPRARRGEAAAGSASSVAAHDAHGPLALADGGDVLPGPATLPEILRRAAHTERTTHYFDEEGALTVVPHATLLAEAEQVLGGLRARGVEAGDAVLIAVREARSILTALWGCVLGGAIPAIVSVPRRFDEASSVLDVLTRAHALLREPLVIAETASLPLPGARIVPLTTLLEGPRDDRHHAPAPTDTAIYNLTSGSTGQPKVIELTHRGLLARARGTNVVVGFTPADRVLSWLPFDHIGSISDWHIRPLELGSWLYYAPKEWVLGEPLRWLELLSAHRITGSWAPNFAFQLLITEHERARARGHDARWDLSRVECLLTAGESVSRQTVQDFVQTFARYGLAPHAVVPAFGMAELGSGVTYAKPMRGQSASFHERDGASFADLGPPVPGCTVRVVDGEGRVLPERVVGQVQFGGAVVSKGYLRASPEQSAAFLADGWFDSGDRGFLAEGRLVLTGRTKDVIIVNGANYYAHEIEAVVEGEAGVDPSYVAAFAVRTPEERLAILFTSTWSSARWPEQVRSIRRAVVARVGINPEVIVPVSRDRIPKTAIGKIMRSRLRDQLESGAFDGEIAEIEAAAGGPGAVPDWFHVRTWIAAERVPDDPSHGPIVLVSGADPRGVTLAQAAAVAIAEHGRRASVVERVADARAVATGLGEGPLTVVSCEAYGGLRAVEVMTSGLAQLPADHALVVVTRRAEERSGSAAIAGWTRALSAERAARLVDLEGVDPTAEAALLAAELVVRGEAEVALSSTGRRVPRLSPLSWPLTPRTPPIEEGAFYTITGGHGGLGQLLARELVTARGAKVLLLGRSGGASSDSIRSRAIDVADAAALEAAIAEAERVFGPLAGVFHLAGVYRERAAAEETADSLGEVCHAKVGGTDALEAVLATRPAAFFVGYSSLAASLGAARLGAYAAANAHLDATATRLRATGRRAWSIAWSAFSEVGMGREAAAGDRLLARGYLPISPARGLASSWAVMTRDEPVVLVGLDRTHAELRWRVLGTPLEARELHGFAVGVAAPVELRVEDARGVPVSLGVEPIEALPRTSSGAVDVDRLLGRSSGARTQPLGEVEGGLAELWRSLLAQGEIAREDDFFALGGHSLLATQLVSRVRERFGVTVPLGKLFEATTLVAMASVIEQLRGPAGDDVASLLDQVQHLSQEELEAILAEDAARTAARTPMDATAAEPGARITTLGIITANRPAALERALDSYLENLRDHGRDLDVVVSDDSRDPATAEENRARMRKLGAKYGLRLHHGWLDTKQRFVEALVRRTGAPHHVAQSSFMRGASGVFACGVNRNSFQMAVAGEAAFLADDDTLCRLSPTPSPRAGTGIAAGIDGAQLWFFADREDAVRSVPGSPADLIGLHEAVLGRSAASLAPERTAREPIAAEIAERLTAPTTRVRVALNGLLGDTGWAVPFGQWGAPMGYLLLDEASRARLLASEESYRRGVVSRQILRVMDRPTLTDATYSMSTFSSFDATSALVPYLVSMRGADLIFGASLWRTHPHTAFAHLPSALFHAPIEKREFHVGELIRTATGFDATRLFINMVRAWTPPGTDDPRARTRALGRWLMEIAALPAVDFWHSIAEQGRRAEEALLARIDAELARHGHAPRWWADDLSRYAETLRRSMTRDAWFHPLDVRATVDSDAAADALTQRMVTELGEMMVWWPDFFDAAVELRREGVRLVEPLR